jgi:hypothetical protein
MTKYNEDPLLWIFESTQDQAQFAAIHECNAKKKAKQEKENAENAHHPNPNTMPSHSTITTLIHWSHQRLSWDLVCLISNNTVIYRTLPPPLLIKTSP